MTIRTAYLFLLALPVSGCIAFSDLDERSTPLPDLHIGMERAAIERQLAPCGNEARTADGRLACVYNVRQVDHQPIVRSVTFVADVLTLGLLSGLCSSSFVCDMTHEEYQRLYLRYGPDDRLESYRIEE